MVDTITFDQIVGIAIKDRAEEIVRRWLGLLDSRLEEQPHDIFPGPTLLNHMPGVIRRLADGVLGDAESVDSAFVRRDVARLASLRQKQGYELAEILLEYELLREAMSEFVLETAKQNPEPIAPEHVVRVALRLDRALSTLLAATSDAYLAEVGTVAEQVGDLLRGFGKNLLHEIRNRLNSVSLNLQLLRATSLDEEQRVEVLDRINYAISRLATATNDVFLVAMGAPRAANSRPQKLSEAIRQVLADSDELAVTHGVVVRIGTPVPPVVVDGARVQLVLLNLVTNAIKYRDAKKGEPSVEVRVERTGNEREWQIDVEDNGLGVNEGDEERIFKPHLRSSDDDSIEGEGLGLSLAYEAVMHLEGRIWIRSEVGKGSVFSFTLKEPPIGLPPPEDQ